MLIINIEDFFASKKNKHTIKYTYERLALQIKKIGPFKINETHISGYIFKDLKKYLEIYNFKEYCVHNIE